MDAQALAGIIESYGNRPVMDLVTDFEKKIQAYTGSRFVLAVNSGTSAIHLALKALGVGPGDLVIAPTFTYVATINPILYQGATPVLVDSEQRSWNMDPELLDRAIQDAVKKNNKPRCVIVVHGYGMPADMKAITTICQHHDIPILEDAAEAIGSTCLGRLAGTFGKVGILSFNNNKTVTTYGGGAILTEDEQIYRQCYYWATQSRSVKPFYEHADIGYNYRMGPLAGAAGLLGLGSVGSKIESRRASFEGYRKLLAINDVDVKWLTEPSGCFSNRWLSTGVFKSLDVSKMISKSGDNGIELRRLWNPMHLQPYFKGYPVYRNGHSEYLFQNGLCLPFVEGEAIQEVVEALISASK